MSKIPDEVSVSFSRAILLSTGRNKKRGLAKFRCDWSDSAAQKFGWREPDGLDRVTKLDRLKATSMSIQQSVEEIGKFQKSGDVDLYLVDGFELVRREGERPGSFETSVYFTVHFDGRCPDALTNLEPFITETVKPSRLQINYKPKGKEPEQTKNPAWEAQREAANA